MKKSNDIRDHQKSASGKLSLLLINAVFAGSLLTPTLSTHLVERTDNKLPQHQNQYEFNKSISAIYEELLGKKTLVDKSSELLDQYEDTLLDNREIELGNDFYLYTPYHGEQADKSTTDSASTRRRAFPGSSSTGTDTSELTYRSPSVERIQIKVTSTAAPLEEAPTTAELDSRIALQAGNTNLNQSIVEGPAQYAHGDHLYTKPKYQREPDGSYFCIGHEDFQGIFHWLCQGSKVIKAPVDLQPEPMSLRLSNTAIEVLTASSFAKYKNTLRDFSMENSPHLISIEPNTFADLIRLRVVYIYQAPKLVSFELSGLHPDLQIIRIEQTGLKHWPNLSNFKQETILSSVDLDNNKISSFGEKPINMRVELLNLEFNRLFHIDEFTFNGSEIGVLLLSDNWHLSYIHPNAFSNLKSLIKLDLSRTSLHQLPTNGLQQLRTLIIRDNYLLKRIPSIYEFPVLEEAHLTYAYHCCSFRYPRTHDPTAYEEHLRKVQEEINAPCRSAEESTQITSAISPSGTKLTTNDDRPSNRQQIHRQEQQQQQQQLQQKQQQSTTSTQQSSDFEGYFEEEQKVSSASGETGIKFDPASSAEDKLHLNLQQVIDGIGLAAPKQTHFTSTSGPDLAGKSGDESSYSATKSRTISKIGGGSFSGSPVAKSKLRLTQFIECGELASISDAYLNISCTPEPDAFNPCEDIMGYSVLRIAVWFVVAASVFGNLSVILVLMGVFRRLSVPKFLQLNLAIGDLFMGVYLAMLAMADLTTVGVYFNYAIDWQHGFGCRVAGAASLFASQLSIFTLSVITFERYYTITYSIDLNMRLQLGWAARIMFIGWIYAFASAMLPIFADINSYSKTSICLPMRTTYFSDRLFIIVLLVIDSSAFIIIFACYLKMYLLILRQKTEATAKERTVAMRMALLVSTDFACWAPIIFFGATALFGRPLISVTNSKILIVFFYPLNSMANPFLYVISTRQYKRDVSYLTSRWHIWRKNLFKKNNDSYYSNNAAYGAAVAQYPAAGLTAHLGAVAAVTGVANHLHHNHLMAANLPLDTEQAAGIKLHEQRFICTRAHPTGQYIIRHQILTDKYVSPALGRAHRMRTLPVQRKANLKSVSPSRRQTRSAQPPETIDEKGDDRRASGASKIVNVAYDLGDNSAGNNKADSNQSALKSAAMIECPVLVMDYEASDSIQADDQRSCSSNHLLPIKSVSRCRLSPRDRTRSSASNRHSEPSLCSRCCGCSCSAFKISGFNENIKSNMKRFSRDSSLEEGAIAVIPLPRVSKSINECKHIDILGNLSTNEPTSSVSEPSSLRMSGQNKVADENSLDTSHKGCHQCCLQIRPATRCGTSESDDHQHRHRHHHHHRRHHHHSHLHHHNHHHHHCRHRHRHHSHLNTQQCRSKRNIGEQRTRCSRPSSCEPHRKCEHLHRLSSSDQQRTMGSSNLPTSLESSHKSSQSQMAVIEITGDCQDEPIRLETPPSRGLSDSAAHVTRATSTGPIQHKELESILKVPSDRLLSPKKSSSQFMSLLLGASPFKHRSEASSLRGSQKGKEKKRVSIMAHHSG